MQNLTNARGFYPFLTHKYSTNNSNDHLHVELVQTKFNPLPWQPSSVFCQLINCMVYCVVA